MVKITYAKGIYTLTDGTKTYTYNINNGQVINIKNNGIVAKPSFKKADMIEGLQEVVQISYYRKGYSNMLEVLLDTLDSKPICDTFGDGEKHLTKMSIWDKVLNVLPSGYLLKDGYNLSKLSNKQISKITKWVQEYNNPNEKVISLQNFINQLKIEELATTCGNLPIDFVREYQTDLESLCKLAEEYRNLALYYFYNQKLYKLRDTMQKHSYYSYTEGRNYILTYIKCCKLMNKTPIKTNNFMREYIETLSAYDLWIKTDKQSRFGDMYNRHKDNLLFEYGNCQVVLPQLVQDLIIEGNEMHHCVGNYIDKVANGETLIVFIRHKNTPNKCYITAEISPDSGKLGQYYLAFDRQIQKMEDIEFKRKYQEWLLSCKW